MSRNRAAHPATGFERKVFLGAIVILALHVADDAFLQPQPGTGAGDHLVSGLAQLVALALGAFCFLRSGGGARGGIAISVGVFGLLLGSEAAAYAVQYHPSGDDFTGFLSLAAGLSLLCLGGRTLWRTRRTGEGVIRTVSRRTALLAAALVAIVFIVIPVGFSYVLTHVARAPVEDIDLGVRGIENVQLTTKDGLTLQGSYVPSTNGAAVVVAFGRLKTQPHARMLIEHGYGVLIFDRRGEGLSDGDPNAFGWDEAELDLDAAVAFLEERPDVELGRIGGLGLSVGGESLLQAAANNPGLAAVVSEGASSRSSGELTSVAGADWSTVSQTAVVTLGTAIFSDAVPPTPLVEQVDDIGPRATFFVYSATGTAGEELTKNPAYYDAASEPKEIWEVPGADHVGGLEAQPAEYERRVVGFFDDHLGR